MSEDLTGLKHAAIYFMISYVLYPLRQIAKQWR